MGIYCLGETCSDLTDILAHKYITITITMRFIKRLLQSRQGANNNNEKLVPYTCMIIVC
jgi:hypothetical protein